MPSTKSPTLVVAVFSLLLGSLAVTAPLFAGNSEKVLYSFKSSPTRDGAYPLAGLIFDSSGNLFGTTTYGSGPYYGGAVFELMPNNGQWVEKKLHGFSGQYGENPVAGVVMDGAGDLFGTLSAGGPHGGGAVFELVSSNGEWKFQIIHGFINNGEDGFLPYAGLTMDAAGNLYGTTWRGGSHSNCVSAGCGTVFELSPGKNGSWTEKILHSFNNNGEDGYWPMAGVTLDPAGNLYGTTQVGGRSTKCSGGCGTVFKLSPGKNGGWTETVLHSFTHSGFDGYDVVSGVILDAGGNIYGTTYFGGTHSSCANFVGCGAVFELVNDGKWTEKLLHSFGSRGDGIFPTAGLIADAKGNLFGTTSAGGSNNEGVVFQLILANGKWTEKVLHTFSGGNDGSEPAAGVILDGVGNLYGTTFRGGASGAGTIFEVTP
jgi:uncharacterized repeat protein (TIGR03803 family)